MGVRDIPLVLFGPRRLFARVEDVSAWGWPLVILLTAVTLIGWATVQTGLIDREIDRQVNASIAVIDQAQRDVVERSALRELYKTEYEMGEFKKLLTRIQVIVAEPAKVLATVLLISAFLYGVVAVTGRKAEWNTLLTIGVFAGFADLLRLLVRLGLMLHYRTLDVYTSLAPATRFMVSQEKPAPLQVAAVSGLLSAVDPFLIWFWIVLALGLATTRQLRSWQAWTICSLCWLIAAAARCGFAVVAVQGARQAAMMSGQ